MTDTQIEKQTSAKPVDQLQTSSPSFDDNDEIYLGIRNNDEVLKPSTDHHESEKTLSIEDDEAQEAQPKTSPPLEKNELTPNTTSTTKSIKEETSKTLADAPPIIDLTEYNEDSVDDEKVQEEDQGKDEDHANEKITDSAQSLEHKNADEPSQKSKRKSKRASSTKRKSKCKNKKSDEVSGSQEKGPKKKLSKKKSVNKVESTDESSKTPSKAKSATTDKETEVPPKSANSLAPVPTTPTKQRKSAKESTPHSNSDDFKKRKEAKERRADDLRNYLGTVGDTLLVQPRSDDSVSYLTIPQTLEANSDQHSDLNKLPKAQEPPRTVKNPMIKMGDDGECEPDRRISYDLEALMRHQVPPEPRHSKWEVVSVITDDVETVLGEIENAEVVNLQSNGVKLGHETCEKEFTDIDLEQPSKNTATAVDCKTTSRATVASVLEDLQSMMIRKPISASVVFVFLVAALVVSGMALMQ